MELFKKKCLKLKLSIRPTAISTIEPISYFYCMAFIFIIPEACNNLISG